MAHDGGELTGAVEVAPDKCPSPNGVEGKPVESTVAAPVNSPSRSKQPKKSAAARRRKRNELGRFSSKPGDVGPKVSDVVGTPKRRRKRRRNRGTAAPVASWRPFDWIMVSR